MNILSQGLDTSTLNKVLSSALVNPELQNLFVDVLILDIADDDIVRSCALSIQRVVAKLPVMFEVESPKLIRECVRLVEVYNQRVCPYLGI